MLKSTNHNHNHNHTHKIKYNVKSMPVKRASPRASKRASPRASKRASPRASKRASPKKKIITKITKKKQIQYGGLIGFNGVGDEPSPFVTNINDYFCIKKQALKDLINAYKDLAL